MSDSDRSAWDDPTAPADVMTLTTTRTGSAAVVTVAGELDLQTARELLAVVDDTLHQPDVTGVVIDLAGVSFIGSSGLGTFAELATRTTTPAGSAPYAEPAAKPQLRIVVPPENRAVIRPWETMNLQQILPLYPDLGSALETL